MILRASPDAPATWERTFAQWIAVDQWAADDPRVIEAANQKALRAVQEALRDAGWTERDLRHPTAPQISLMVARDHADYWTNRRVVIFAEARALDLRTADLLPKRMHLWGRRSRVR